MQMNFLLFSCTHAELSGCGGTGGVEPCQVGLGGLSPSAVLSKPCRASRRGSGISLEAFNWEFWGLEIREQNPTQQYQANMKGF